MIPLQQFHDPRRSSLLDVFCLSLVTLVPFLASSCGPGPGENIVYTRVLGANSEVFIMDADGTGQTRLTDHPAHDFSPALSPDETKIAFVSDRDGSNEIHVMNVDGTNVTQLTNTDRYTAAPAWSPDGGRIAFVRQDSIYNMTRLVRMNADGTGQQQSSFTYSVQSVAWSPNGKGLAFQAYVPGAEYEIVVMDSVGGVHILTNDPGQDWQPSWSPDGRKIAFSSRRGGVGTFEIYVINVDGTGLQRLTDNYANDFHPAWSQNGKLIAFESHRDASQSRPSEIYFMLADGSSQSRLTDDTYADRDPNWGIASR